MDQTACEKEDVPYEATTTVITEKVNVRIGICVSRHIILKRVLVSIRGKKMQLEKCGLHFFPFR